MPPGWIGNAVADAIERVEVLVSRPVRNYVTLRLTTFAIQEYLGYADLVHEAFPQAWYVADGHLQRGDEPGLGVTIDHDLHNPEDYEPAYLPVARRRDGTLTDW